MPKATEHAQIPLMCSICPKSPKFSDVSHLLTHISSKSHLHNKFQLEVQATQQSLQQLRTYQNWFDGYGIARLLGERMSTKENKKNGVKKQKTVRTQPKVEIKDENINPALYNQQAGLYDHVQSQGYRPPMPPMQTLMQAPMNSWAGGYNGSHGTPAPVSDLGDDSPYDTPTMRNNVPNFAPGPFEANEMSDLAAETATSKNAYDLEEEENEEDPHEVPQASQLKGVKWPGMSLFDSATPEMKRRRNQKKDGSILEGMKLTSTTVQPTEVVYHSDGRYKRTKPIYGNSDSEEENQELTEVLTPVKRRGRKTNAMKKIDGNVPRLRKSSAMNGSNKPGRRTRSDMMNLEDGFKLGNISNNPEFSFRSALPMSRSTSSHTTSTEVSKYEPSMDGDDDFPNNFREIRPAKKSKIRVFRDDDRGSFEEDSPGRTESTLEEHRFDEFQPESYQPASISQSLASPSPAPAYSQNLGVARYPSNQVMGRSREYSENMNPNGVSDYRFEAEREATRRPHASSSSMFAATYHHHHSYEQGTINPLRSGNLPHHPLQSRAYPYAYSDSNGFAGEFRPLGGPQTHTPLPSYLSGGPSSGNDDTVSLSSEEQMRMGWYMGV